jgi:GNAT superfamily N-acetyltransferase
MEGVQQDLSASALVTAIEANLFAMASLFRHWPQAEVHDDEWALWTLTNIAFPLFNSVMRTRLAADQVKPAIEAALGRCRSRKVPMMWWTGPATEPTDLGKQLEAHGFRGGGSSGMAADLRLLPDVMSLPAGLAIEQVTDSRSAQMFSQVMCAGFGMPPFVGEAFVDLFSSLGLGPQAAFRHYLGRVNGQAVGASSLVLRAGVAGIYNVSTVPDARRSGIGRAMTLHPLREARAAGYRVGILHSSQMGLSVYRGLGFEEYCKIGQYMWVEKPDTGAG